MSEKNTDVIVGKISAAHGVRGAVLVFSYTQKPNTLFELPLKTRDGDKIKLQLLHQKAPGKYVCKIDGILDRNAAEKVAKWQLYCSKEALPAIDEDEFYIADIIGLPVKSAEGKEIGQVVYVHNFGADDIIEVKLIADNSKLMVPFTKEFVPEVRQQYIICEIDKLNDK